MPIHIVQKGDNLWKLSQDYGVSVNRIISANGLEEPGKLVSGEALFIPDAQPRYTVRPGDTLQAIANRYDVTVKSIMDTNQLKSPPLCIGVLIVRGLCTRIVLDRGIGRQGA